MAIVVVFSAITIEYVKQHTVLIVGIISMVILTPYEMTLYKELDDTRVTWNVLEQVAQTLQANQVVLIRGEDMKFYYLPLSAMTEAVCMPYTENIEDDIKERKNDYYYLTQERTTEEGGDLIFSMEYQLSEDNNFFDGNIIPFPLDVTKEIRQAVIWKKHLAE